MTSYRKNENVYSSQLTITFNHEVFSVTLGYILWRTVQCRNISIKVFPVFAKTDRRPCNIACTAHIFMVLNSTSERNGKHFVQLFLTRPSHDFIWDICSLLLGTILKLLGPKCWVLMENFPFSELLRQH